MSQNAFAFRGSFARRMNLAGYHALDEDQGKELSSRNLNVAAPFVQTHCALLRFRWEAFSSDLLHLENLVSRVTVPISGKSARIKVQWRRFMAGAAQVPEPALVYRSLP